VGFTINRLTRLKDTCEEIFSPNIEPKGYTEQYNPLLLEAVDRFKALYQALLSRYPSYKLSIFYVTKGDTKTIGPDIKGTAADIGKSVCALLPQFEAPVFQFIGARELIELSSKPPKLDFTLQCSGMLPSKRQGGYVGYVSLVEFANFITENQQLRTSLFESNVRDYQGKVLVNEAIADTLENAGTEDFWWLNNGITIVAQRAVGEARQIQLTDPQIVNGLQTSQKIYDYSKQEKAKTDVREVLVRVIQAPDPQSHDSIIRATNSQTSIPIPFLWATSQIHRDIEHYFDSRGLYYDRRKNSWRREGIAFDKVVGITELAQSVAAILRQEPDHARARPGRFFGKSNHAALFSEKYEPDMYVVCARLKKKATLFLKSVESEKADRNNLLFYLLMGTVCIALKSRKPRASKIASLNVDSVDDAVFHKALGIVRPIYEKFGANDIAAKGTEMVSELREVLKKRYRVKPTSPKSS
jgi:hypothetical protein